MKHRLKFLACTLVVALVGAGRSQGFNVDLEMPGFPALGAGAPQNSFGAAGNQTGNWYPLDISWITHYLIGLDGNVSSVQILGSQGGSGGGSNLPQNTGDYRRLLNDATGIGLAGASKTIHLEGLVNGRYKLVTYSVSISVPSEFAIVRVSSPQATNGVQTVMGSMPGNQLIQGNTHTVHSLNITQNKLDFTLMTEFGMGYFNGFQIVPEVVPEPNSLLGLALFALLARKRKGSAQHQVGKESDSR